MHELALLQNLLDEVLIQAREHRAARIERVHLQVGELSGVEPQALSFAFPGVVQGTPAEGADLEIEMIPVVAECPACGCEFSPPDVVFMCPCCESLSGRILRGTELCLYSLELSFDAR